MANGQTTATVGKVAGAAGSTMAGIGTATAAAAAGSAGSALAGIGTATAAAAAVPVAGWIIAGIGAIAGVIGTGIGRKKAREEMVAQGEEQLRQVAEQRGESRRKANIDYQSAIEDMKTAKMETDVRRKYDAMDMQKATDDRQKRLDQQQLDNFSQDVDIREQLSRQNAGVRSSVYGL